MKKKLAIVTTHPIQYYAPLFRQLGSDDELKIKVFYTWPQAQIKKFDPGFGKVMEWDIPLLDGYEFEFIENSAKDPGTHHFKGIKNLALIPSLSSWNPDFILIFGWSFESHFETIKYFHKKIPVWFRGDSHLLDPISKIKKIVRWLWLHWVYSHIDTAFYVGKENLRYFKWCGLKDNQLIWAPHAIDNQRFSDLTGTFGENALMWRHQLGIHDTDMVFLYAGKFEQKKGISDLLTAFCSASDKNMKLIIAGSGELESELKANVKDNEQVIWLPVQNQTQMPVLYRMASCFVYPSRGPGETWGLAVNEAMASGRMCIVSDKVGCAADLITNGETGFIFETGNINQLTDLINNISANPALSEKMGKNALKKIQAYSFKQIKHAVKAKAFS
ncbi:MAG: glycosyltransferase family 4 protein [Bacteroidetes bacterium]|nr:glycosyltransferase family 4 protein [Bacteroidota bacterium]